MALALALITAVGPAVQAVPVAALEDPFNGRDRFHGVATDGSEDTWTDGELCEAAFQWFEIELAIDAGPPVVLASTTLELVAPHHVDPRTEIDRRTTATPGEPATLEIYQDDGCLDFQVLGIAVEGVAPYTVTCLSSCDGDWP